MGKRKNFNPYTLKSIRAIARMTLAKALSHGRCPGCGSLLRREGNRMSCGSCDTMAVAYAQAKVVAHG